MIKDFEGERFRTEGVEVSIIKKDSNNKAVKDENGETVYLAKETIKAEQYTDAYIKYLEENGLLKSGHGKYLNCEYKTKQQDKKRSELLAGLEGKGEIKKVTNALKDVPAEKLAEVMKLLGLA